MGFVNQIMLLCVTQQMIQEGANSHRLEKALPPNLKLKGSIKCKNQV